MAGKFYTVQFCPSLNLGGWKDMTNINATSDASIILQVPVTATNATGFDRIVLP